MSNIAGRKGRSFGGYWWFGFCLFLPALIVACAVSDLSYKNAQIVESSPLFGKNDPLYLRKQEDNLLEAGGWRCSRCRRVNPRNMGFCSCGISRGESSKIDELLTTENLVNKEEVSDMNTKVQILKKYKELLDAGIISQDEFENKKKELL